MHYPTAGEFKCCLKTSEGLESWTGRWAVYEMKKNQAELEICDSCMYHVIVGTCYGGHYLCIPNWNVGCSLSMSLTDTFWNYEQISQNLKPVNAKTVTMALADFSEKTGWGN